MPDRRMYRYTVPVDNEAHEVEMSSTTDPVAVAASDGLRVEFWAECLRRAPQARRSFRVFGTGDPLPDDARWAGTCARTSDGLVWHLYEVPGA